MDRASIIGLGAARELTPIARHSILARRTEHPKCSRRGAVHLGERTRQCARFRSVPPVFPFRLARYACTAAYTSCELILIVGGPSSRATCWRRKRRIQLARQSRDATGRAATERRKRWVSDPSTRVQTGSSDSCDRRVTFRPVLALDQTACVSWHAHPCLRGFSGWRSIARSSPRHRRPRWPDFGFSHLSPVPDHYVSPERAYRRAACDVFGGCYRVRSYSRQAWHAVAFL